MSTSLNLSTDQERALSELARLRRFADPPAEFWPPYLEAVSRRPPRRSLPRRDQFRGPAIPVQWRKLAEWPAPQPRDRAVLTFTKEPLI